MPLYDGTVWKITLQRLRVTNPSTALNLAYLLRVLADATPGQHSELADLVSAAAAITMSHDAAPG